MNMNEIKDTHPTESGDNSDAASEKARVLRMSPITTSPRKPSLSGSKKVGVTIKKKRRTQVVPGDTSAAEATNAAPTTEDAPSPSEKKETLIFSPKTPQQPSGKTIDLEAIESEKKAVNNRLKNDQEEAEKKAELRKQHQEETAKGKDEKETETSLDLSATPKPQDQKTQDTEKTAKTAPRALETRERRDSTSEEEGKGRLGKITQQRRQGKLTISQALAGDDESKERTRSLSAILRKREKERQQSRRALEQKEKIIREVTLPETITVSELASRMAERASDVIKALLGMGVSASPDSEIDADTAELIVNEFQHKVRRVADSDVESFLDDINISEKNLVEEPRPPVVTVMGHVDHGKTSLLDALRNTRVQASEAGGITQRISAYQTTLTHDKRQVTFIDTPGHEAFTAMRARGANVTDIVILIVAADSGVMPQTREAVSHAQAAGVPIVVAINKVDLPTSNIDKIYNQLLEINLVPEHLGGDILCVPISAKTGEGLDNLLSSVLLQADLQECKSTKTGLAKGHVLEAYIDKGRGCVTTLLVTKGTLKVGDVFVVGTTWGKVRGLSDDQGQKIKVALPSQPVEVLGASSPPKAGDVLQVMPSDKESRAPSIAEYRQALENNQRLSKASHVESIEDMFDRFHENLESHINLVVKADVQGMVEAITASLGNIESEHGKIRILHAGVGPVNASDVALASTSHGTIIAFGVKVAPEAQRQARQDTIDITHHSIIHHLLEDIESRLESQKEPEIIDVHLGTAEVRDIFDRGRIGKVAGCSVITGSIQKTGYIIVTRGEDDIVFKGKIKQLRRFRDEVNTVNSGYECGISCEGFEDYLVGDRIACYGQDASQG